jgi:hypothetical protein
LGATAIVVTPGVEVNGVGGAGGTVGASAFRALGFSNGTTGQAGSTGNTAQTLPTDIFVIGGNGGNTSLATGHYGYTVQNLRDGYGIITPIINSMTNRESKGESSATSFAENCGFGCGGNGASVVLDITRYGMAGGPGLAVIISW